MTRNILFMLIFFWCHRMFAQSSMHTFQGYKMGTEFNIKIYGQDSIPIQKAVQLVWAKIDSINATFSDYSTSSELARLQHDTSGAPVKLSPEFAFLMDISLKYSILSKGAFDVSVGALSRLWRRAIKMNDFPEAEKIKAALKFVGYKKIKWTNGAIQLPKGMHLDFGAIAKGYAVDQAYAVLKAQGYPISLVDGGGDIYAGPSPPGQPGWSITTTIKQGNQWKDSVLHISSAAIVTSGDAYKFIEDPQGRRYSHIINSKTGYGIPGPHLTTVIAANATHADALATTISVMKRTGLNSFKRRWKKIFPDVLSNWKYSVFQPLDIN